MKKIYSKIITPLIMSIFGSILYSKFIDPNFDSSINFLGSFFAKFSTSYLNYIYENIGDGIKEIFSYYTYVISFVSFFTFTVLIYILPSLRFLFRIKNDNTNMALNKYPNIYKSKLLYIFNIITTMFLLIYMISISIKHHYTYNAIIYIEKSLDILAPKISEQDRLELKAEYRYINSYKKFKSFNDKIIKISKETNTVIPEFKLIVK
ncbi:hypothetical protein HZP56_08610 [Elizabethkingia anophelis]|nr:hypothetical protein [Elizabethkingia anophelis]MCT4176842.1 hypothetical protein [Elizabethkingia anophelis]